jgi:hypothetical protein
LSALSAGLQIHGGPGSHDQILQVQPTDYSSSLKSNQGLTSVSGLVRGGGAWQKLSATEIRRAEKIAITTKNTQARVAMTSPKPRNDQTADISGR